MQLTPHSLLFALWLVAVAVLARQGASGARQSANAVVGCLSYPLFRSVYVLVWLRS